MMLDFRTAKKLVAQHGTPIHVISRGQLVHNYHALHKALPRAKIYYAVKANAHKGILHVMRDVGANFDAASYEEIKDLLELEVDVNRIIFANPVKRVEDIIKAYNVGIDTFVYDNDAELQKLTRYAPEADVLLRVFTSNDQAYYKLSSKFGCQPKEAIRLLKKAKKFGLNPVGLAFNAGSQNTTSNGHVEGIQTCAKIFKAAKKEGLTLTHLDMGGGYPVKYGHEKLDNGVDPKKMIAEINDALDEYIPESIHIIAEPGRFIVGDAAVLIMKVIGKDKRKGVNWYYLDDGYYHSFSDMHASKWKFDFVVPRRGKKHLSVLAGPTCDSFDVMGKGLWLPELEVGDLVITPNIGAYSWGLSTHFNGFDPAKVVYVK